MTFEQARKAIQEIGSPQQPVAMAARLNTASLNLWLRGAIELHADQVNRIEIAVQAMQALTDESVLPIDWRKYPSFNPSLRNAWLLSGPRDAGNSARIIARDSRRKLRHRNLER